MGSRTVWRYWPWALEYASNGPFWDVPRIFLLLHWWATPSDRLLVIMITHLLSQYEPVSTSINSEYQFLAGRCTMSPNALAFGRVRGRQSYCLRTKGHRHQPQSQQSPLAGKSCQALSHIKSLNGKFSLLGVWHVLTLLTCWRPPMLRNHLCSFSIRPRWDGTIEDSKGQWAKPGLDAVAWSVVWSSSAVINVIRSSFAAPPFTSCESSHQKYFEIRLDLPLTKLNVVFSLSSRCVYGPSIQL